MTVVSVSQDNRPSDTIAPEVVLTHSDEIHFFWFPGFGFSSYLPEGIETKEDGNVDI